MKNRKPKSLLSTQNVFAKLRVYTWIISVLMILSCTTSKNNPVNPQTPSALKPFVLKFERGPCFGQCPVYSFYVLEDHTGLVHAKANLMDTAGWYFTPLDQESLVEILETIEPTEWWLPNLNNQPEIMDLPTSTLVYQHPKGVRTVTIQSRTNESLEHVFGKLGHLVSESKWKPTQLRPLETPVADQTDLIVQLRPGVDIQEWMKKFDRFGILLRKRLTPNQSYYLVSKDPEKGHANDFLQYIKLDADVINAQWDKQVQKRN